MLKKYQASVISDWPVHADMTGGLWVHVDVIYVVEERRERGPPVISLRANIIG